MPVTALLPLLLAVFLPGPSLTLMWEVKDLKTPESVLYDRDQGVLYVSNINGNPTDKDGNGFITKLSAKGEVLDYNWASSLDAPKGMALSGATLYVTDIDRLVAIDTKTGKAMQSWQAEGAQFLNDVAVSLKGAVFVSDSRANRLYRLRPGGTLDLFSEDSLLIGPNGMHMQGSKLMVGTRKGILSVEPASGRAQMAVPNVEEPIDGLFFFKGGYLVSDWNGKVAWLKRNKAPVVLLNTTDAKVNAADFEFIPETRMLIIPTFRDHRVRAYSLVWK